MNTGTRIRRLISLAFALPCFASVALCNDSLEVKWSALADVMYSYSLNAPPDHMRAYSTQPSRDREIGLMQAQLSIDGSTDWFRGKVTLQGGWFPNAVYTGADSNWRNLQEAKVGIRITDSLWIDAGIMYSHIGYESMIGRSNLTLGRSMTADYTPYYETGAALTWTPDEHWTLSALVLNGWQQIVDVNSEASFGTRIAYAFTKDATLSWSTYYGNDMPSSMAQRFRFHNNVWFEVKPVNDVTAVLLLDHCSMEASNDMMVEQWYAGVIGAWSITDMWRIAARVEHYNDPNSINVAMMNGIGFETTGVSMNVDLRPTKYTMVRAEIRSFFANTDAFPKNDGFTNNDTYFTVSTSFGL